MDTKFKNLEFLIEGNGDITLGRIGPVECAGRAIGEGQLLAMLVRRPGEPLLELLARLDAAVGDALESEIFIDETRL